MPPSGLIELVLANFIGIRVLLEGSILKLWTKCEIATFISVSANLIPI